MGFGLMQSASETRAEFIRFPGEVDAASADKMDGCSPPTCPAKGGAQGLVIQALQLVLGLWGKCWEERCFANPSWVYFSRPESNLAGRWASSACSCWQSASWWLLRVKK
jgi:hypothetical protein